MLQPVDKMLDRIGFKCFKGLFEKIHLYASVI